MTIPSQQSNASHCLRWLLDACLSIPRPQSTTLVGIDGRGGAGKSTLATALARLDPRVSIIHIDDFYSPLANHNEMGAAINWHRVIEQVLSLLRQDQPARYQRFDWETQRLKEWHNVPVGGIVILEGLYSIRRELAEYLSYRIWVEIPRDVGMERGIARDGKGSRSWWLNEWIPDEDRYIDEERPAEGALLIVDGSTIGLALLEKGQYLQVG